MYGTSIENKFLMEYSRFCRVNISNVSLDTPGVTSSEPHCKILVVLRHPREVDDVPPKNLQLNPIQARLFLPFKGPGGGL